MNRKVILGGASFVALAALAACSQDSADETSFGEIGLAVQIEGDYTVSTVEISIENEDPEAGVSRNRSLNVSDPNAAIRATEGGLPEGNYSVALAASLEDDPDTDVDESEIDCEGSVGGVEVIAGSTAEADLVLTCTVDGGNVQVAGGIRIDAETETEVVNTCPDLIDEAFVGPLDTSVGASVQLLAETADDVSVEWSASAGTISDDGTSYTCPSTPGVYTLLAEFSGGSGCEQEFTEQVNCHGSYDGPVETLPTAFAFSGSCNISSPCHLTQDGTEWSAVCGSRPDRSTVLTGGAVDENSFAFLDGGDECVGSVVDGEFVGTCTDFAGETCDFASDSNPAPNTLCPTLAELTDVTTCSGSYDSCDVAQDGCDILAKCGDTYLGRNVNADGSVRVEEYHDSMLFRCEAPTVDGVATGSCVQSGRGLSDPVTCDYSAEIVKESSACEETLPSSGFVLQGCGFDDMCFARQQGCAWELVCNGGVYGGIASATDAFEFVGPNGESCSAGVVGGEIVGDCGSCSFGSVQPEVDESCMQLPEELAARGCRYSSPTPFAVLQNGCAFMGATAGATEFVVGNVSELGVSFPGINDAYMCTAELNEAGDALWGDCEIPREDGSVGSCRDLTSDQGAPLVLAF